MMDRLRKSCLLSDLHLRLRRSQNNRRGNTHIADVGCSTIVADWTWATDGANASNCAY